MNQRYWKKYSPLIVLLLTAFLLTSCLMRRGPEPDATPATVGQDYEQYDEATMKFQTEFDHFTDELFKKEVVNSTIDLHYSLADPAAFGITEAPVTFGDYTLDRMQKDSQDMLDLKAKLKEMDHTKLRKDQQITYQILVSYLDTELTGQGMELYSQPFTTTIGLQAQLPVLLAEYTFRSKQDVETYLALLSQIDTYYAQIIEFEKAKSEAGLFMNDTSVDRVIESCSGYLLPPDHSFLTETFETRLGTLTDVTEAEKADYIARNRQILEEHFIPAYQLIVDGLTALKGTGVNDSGLSGFPDGKKYYKYLVASNTGTSYNTIEKLKKAIETQMDSDLHAMSELIRSNPKSLDQLETYSFRYTDPNEILTELQEKILIDFPALPECNYSIKYVPEALQNALSPAFFLTPPIDLFQDNVIYINGSDAYKNSDLYTTLAHEGYPGHLYQTVYFANSSTCNLRQLLSFPSYSEGWATYVEHYAYTLDNGLPPDLGQILAYNSSSALALHALLDININYYGWDKEKVSTYLEQFYNVKGTDIVDTLYYALIENPTNYLEYYVGYLEFSNMKQEAQKKLGNAFVLKDFNEFMLNMGPAPFTVIRTHFDQWLLSPHN